MAKKKNAKATVNPPTCDYCGAPPVYCPSSEHVYRGVDYGPIYQCAGCDAWVGVHRGTLRALGRLANKELRQAKQRAHAAFDPLWQRVMERDGLPKYRARGRGYKWLAEQMGLTREQMHIGELDVDQCAKVVEICKSLRKKG